MSEPLASPLSPRLGGAHGSRATALLALGRVLLFMAWRNLWRNRARSGLTVAAFTLGLALMIGTGALIDGLLRQMVSYATDLSLSHIQIHRDAFIEDRDLYATIPPEVLPAVQDLGGEIPGLTAAPRWYAAGLAASGQQSTGAILKAIDPAQEARVSKLHDHVRDGRYLPEQPGAVAESDTGYPVYPVVLGYRLARALRAKVGDELVLITQAADGSIGNGLFRIEGTLDPIDPAFDRMGVLMHHLAYQTLMALSDGPHEIGVHVGDPATLDAVRDRIAGVVARVEAEAAEPADPRDGPLRVRTWAQIAPTVHELLRTYEVTMWIIMVIFLGVAGLGMLNTMLMAVFERTREFATLSALGMGRLPLLTMVLLESVFLSVVSAVVGTAAGIALSLYLVEEGIDFSAWLPDGFDFQGIQVEPVYRAYLTTETVVESVAIMVIIALLASLVPAWHAVRTNAAAAIK